MTSNTMNNYNNRRNNYDLRCIALYEKYEIIYNDKNEI